MSHPHHLDPRGPFDCDRAGGLAWWRWWRCALILLAPTLPAAAQSVTVVDVMVLYTAQARTAAGGAAAMDAQVDLAVAEANLVFQNSRANVRARLVHRGEVGYIESGSVRMDLERLRAAKDGFLDEAHTLRSQHAADLVCLVTESGADLWFQGLQGPSAANAFSVLRRRYLAGDYWFPVVLSFNFGCQLERPYADSVGAFPFSHGHTAHTEVGPFSSVDALDGQRVPYFSNPDLTFGGTNDVPSFRLGVPAGLPGAADNVRTLNLTAPVVAAFRGAAPMTQPPTLRFTNPAEGSTVNARDPLTVTVAASDSDGTVRRVDLWVEREDGSGRRLLGSATNFPWSIAVNGLPDGGLTLLAQARDDAGACSFARVGIMTTNAPPSNDHFTNATVLEGTNVTIKADNSGATIEPGELVWHEASVWFSWKAPANGRLAVSVPETTGQSTFAVFTGETFQDLTYVANNGSPWGERFSQIEFDVTRETTYRITLQGTYGDPSVFTLSLSLVRALHVHLLQPGAGQRFSADSAIALAAEVETVPPAAVMRVEFLADGNVIGSAKGVPFEFPWTNATPGYHQLAARAFDSSGASRESPPIRITVAPENDDFARRIPLAGTSRPGSNRGATNEPAEPAHAGQTASASVWYSWTAPGPGRVTVTISAISLWPAVDVYTGNSLGSLAGVASHHAAFGFPAIVSFDAVAGVEYPIAVSSAPTGPREGEFLIAVGFTEPPPNDAFAARLELTGSSLSVTGTTLAASAEASEPLHAGQPAGRSAWWDWTAPASGNVEMAVDAAGFQARLAIYSGTTLSSLAPVASTTNRLVSFRAVAGTAYQIAVDGLSGGFGDYTLRLVTAPPNDDFTNSILLTGFSLVITGANVAATLETGEPAHGDLPGGRSVWWSWTAPADGWLEIDPRYTTAFERMVAVYTGAALTNLSRVAASSTTFFTVFGLNVRGGETYHIAVAGVDRGAGPLSGAVELRLNETPLPANDLFEDRIVLTGTNLLVPLTNQVATFEPGEPQHGAEGGHSVWYSWTAPASGRATFWAFATEVDTLLGVYQGDSMASLAPVGTRRYYWNFLFNSTFTAGITLNAVAGATYQIAVDSHAPQAGLIGLVLNFSPWPPNDSFLGRQSLAGTNIEIRTSNLGASLEPAEPSHAGRPPARSVWFNWVAPASGTVRVEVKDSFVPLRWAAYTGNALWNLVPVASATSDPAWPAAVIHSFPVVAGQSFKIAVDDIESNNWPVEGFFTLGLTLFPTPANDDFERGMVLAGNALVTQGTTAAATRQPGEPAHGSGLGTLWWEWTAPQDGTVILDASTSAVPIALFVYQGSTLTNLTPIAGGSRRLLFRAGAGATYRVAAEQAEPGDGGPVSFTMLLSQLRLVSPLEGAVFHQPRDLRLAAASGPEDGEFARMSYTVDGALLAEVPHTKSGFLWTNAPLGRHRLAARGTNDAGWVHETLPSDVAVRPSNDDFAARTSLRGGTDMSFHATALAGSLEPNEPASDLVSVWYSWTAPFTGRAQVNVSGWFRPQARAFRGAALGQLVEVAPGPAPELWFDAQAGQSYAVAALAPATLPDQFLFRLQLHSHPSNDQFSARSLLPSEPDVLLHGTCLAATVEENEPATEPASVWYAWIAPFYGRALINVEGGSGPQARIFRGTQLDQLLEVAPGPAHALEFDAEAGQAYAIAIQAPPTIPDNFLLGLQLEPRPANDAFVARTPLTGVSAYTNGTVLAATREPDEPPHGGNPGRGSVWWSWTAPVTGPVTLRADTSGWTPLLAAYTGNTLTSLQPLGTSTGNTLSFRAQAGAVYAIALDGTAPGDGNFGLWLTLSPAPPNDDFATRTILPGTAEIQFHAPAQFASLEPDEPPTDLGSVWYSWTPPFNGKARVSISAWFGPQVRVFLGDALGQLTELAPGPAAEVWFDADTNHTYAIAALAPPHLPDQFLLQIHLHPGPANDRFAARAPLAGSVATASGSLQYAGREPGEPLHAGRPGGNSVWWTWRAPESGVATLSVSAAAFSPIIAVYSGEAVSNLVGLASSVGSTLNFPITNGATYAIALDNDGGAGRDYTLTLTWTVPLTDYGNDDFADRASLTGLSAGVHAGNATATTEEGELLPSGASGRTLWWTWTAPTNVLVRMVTTGSDFQGGSLPGGNLPPSASGPLVTVYTGGSLTNLSLVASNSSRRRGPRGEPFRWDTVPELSFAASSGATFQISVDGLNGGSGVVVLNLLSLPTVPPVNDDFARRLPLAGPSLSVNASNRFATKQAGEPDHGDDPGGASVWWSWTAPGTGLARIEVGDEFAAALGVYTGDSVSNLVSVTGGTMAVEFHTTAGTTYQIAIDGAGGGEGEFSWSLALTPPPPNDRFANRVALTGSHPAANGKLRAATREPMEPSIGTAPAGGTVWFAWRAPVSGTVVVAEENGNGLGVYAGAGVARLLPLAQGEGAISFYAAAGVHYAMAVEDYQGLGTTFALVLFAPPPPPSLDATSVIRDDDGGFRLRVSGTNAQSFALQASTNLADWETLAIDTLQNPTLEFVDTDAALFPQRFYRVLPLEALLAPGPLRVAPGSATSPGVFAVDVLGPAGQPFILESSEDLGAWTERSRAWMIGDAFHFDDGAAGGLPHRFYRAVPFR